MKVPFGVQSRPGFDGQESTVRIINGYVEQWNGSYPTSIVANSGLKNFSTDGTGKCRMLMPTDSELYSVIGTQIRATGTDGTSREIATLAGTKPVRASINDKATQQIALSADDGNYIIESDTLTKVTDADLPPSVDNTFMDGYTIWFIGDGRAFFSVLSESGDISSLSFYESEKKPDGHVGGIASGQHIWHFGPQTVEVRVNTGNQDLPFTRVATFEIGCSFRDTIQTIRQAVFWVGDGGVYQATGLTPQVISTPSVNEAIRTASSDIVGSVRQERGRVFYTLTCDDWTWDYNISTRSWAERKSTGLSRWRIEQIAEFGGKLIGGDYTNGKLYELDFDTYDEAGSPLILEMVSDQMFNKDGSRVFYSSINIDIQRGAGLNSTDAEDTDPDILLDWSNDGGKTFTGERTLKVGKMGERSRRVQDHRLGSDYKRAFRLRMPTSTAKQFFGAEIG